MSLRLQQPYPGTFLASRSPSLRNTVAPRQDLHDAYLWLLCFALAGYALLGKGFAYFGYPPLLIGEVAMMLGLLVIFRSRCGFAMLASLPSVLLVALIGWVTLRVIPFFGVYGLDAVRDSVLVVYGVFAFAVIALMLEKPERLAWCIRAFSGFAWMYGFVGGAAPYFTTSLAAFIPAWPVSGFPIVYLKLNEAAVHLGGVAVFVLLGFRRVTSLWVLVLIGSIVMITPSRGAMLACVVPIGIAALLGGQVRRFASVVGAGVAILMLLYVSDLEIPVSAGRTLGPEQIVANVESLFGTSQSAVLDGTKEWRLRWWKAIEDYTFHGPYFWTGKGFGMGLAEEDGFVVGKETGGPIVRSPHNAHLTMLARSGVPGLVLWLVTGVAWFAMLLRSMAAARARGHTEWANLFIWIGCYNVAVIIDASFDVALEGPMLGIWFWSLFGFGIAASMIYRWDTSRGAAPRPLLAPVAPAGAAPTRAPRYSS
jgi:hypothetical protein